jgi:hypothetical protein
MAALPLFSIILTKFTVLLSMGTMGNLFPQFPHCTMAATVGASRLSLESQKGQEYTKRSSMAVGFTGSTGLTFLLIFAP